MIARIRSQPDVTEVDDPFAVAGVLSPDGRTAIGAWWPVHRPASAPRAAVAVRTGPAAG